MFRISIPEERFSRRGESNPWNPWGGGTVGGNPMQKLKIK